MMERILRWSVVAYVATLVLEGPLRWLLAKAGLSPLIYLRDVLLAGLIVLIVTQGVVRQRPINVAAAVLAWLLLFHALIGAWYLPNLYQTLFGLKILLPLFFAVVAYPRLQSCLPRLVAPLGILLLVALAGVLVDRFIDYPWRGATYEIANQVITGQRVWWAEGAERIAGFSRVSHEAATQIALLAGFVLAFSRRPLLELLVVAAAAVAIYLTTTKGAFLAFMVVALFLLTARCGPAAITLWRAAPAAVALIVMLVPSVLLTWGHGLAWSRTSRIPYLRSFFERIEEVWPAGIELIGRSGSYVLGRGVGGIGVAQRYFEGLWRNPADNVFLFCYISFGVLGCVYLLWLGVRATRLRIDAPGVDRMLFTVILIFLVYGLTTSSLENALQTLLLGFAVAAMAQRTAAELPEPSWRGGAASARPAPGGASTQPLAEPAPAVPAP